jgi:hypothetical protein
MKALPPTLAQTGHTTAWSSQNLGFWHRLADAKSSIFADTPGCYSDPADVHDIHNYLWHVAACLQAQRSVPFQRAPGPRLSMPSGRRQLQRCRLQPSDAHLHVEVHTLKALGSAVLQASGRCKLLKQAASALISWAPL